MGFWGSPGWGCSALHPQLLKKIKRCERKGSESVTEEKCAVLFSTNVTLTPSNVSIHLQVPAPFPWDVLSLPLWDACAALGQSLGSGLLSAPRSCRCPSLSSSTGTRTTMPKPPCCGTTPSLTL